MPESAWKEEHNEDSCWGAPEEASPPDDSVHLYLKEMGAVPLLNREGEVRLARRMEGGNRRVRKTLSRAPWLWKKVLRLDEELSENQRGLRSLLDLETGDGSLSARKRAQAGLHKKGEAPLRFGAFTEAQQTGVGPGTVVETKRD